MRSSEQKRESPAQNIREACLAMLARREHSQLEIRHKLQARGYESPEIEQVLEEFVAQNWQSDARFGESYLRDRVAKGFGPVRIRYELQQRGVDPEQAFEAEPQDWDVVLEKVYERKFGHAPIRDFKDRTKRMRFLQQRGFDAEMIRRLMKQFDDR